MLAAYSGEGNGNGNSVSGTRLCLRHIVRADSRNINWGYQVLGSAGPKMRGRLGTWATVSNRERE